MDINHTINYVKLDIPLIRFYYELVEKRNGTTILVSKSIKCYISSINC